MFFKSFGSRGPAKFPIPANGPKGVCTSVRESEAHNGGGLSMHLN